MEQYTRILSRIIFMGSFLLIGIAVLEKLINLFGYTFLRDYDPWRLLELSAVALLFVIALQLREIKILSEMKGQK